MGRHDLSRAQWRQLAPLLPPENPDVGRPAHPHRGSVYGILWILATGAPGRDLPAQDDSWQSVSNRFCRWRRAGIWSRILGALLQQAGRRGQLDWSVDVIDSMMVRAHQHAAGARGGQSGGALGRSRGGFSTKIHVRAEQHGKPVVLLVTAGQHHDQTVFELLVGQSNVGRCGCGRPRRRPARLVGDRGYSSRRIRWWLRRHGVVSATPSRTSATRSEVDLLIACCSANAARWSAASTACSSFAAWRPATRHAPATLWRCHARGHPTLDVKGAACLDLLLQPVAS